MVRINCRKFGMIAVLLAAIFLCSDKSQAMMNTDYYQAGVNTWVCSSTATLALAAGLTVGTTGLLINNPQGSQFKLVLLETTIGITASPAAAATFELAWSSGPVTSTTNGALTTAFVGLSTVTLVNQINSSVPSFAGNCWVAGTLPATPIFFRPLGGVTGASSISPYYITDKSYPPGSVVIPPGSTISLQATAAISELASFTVLQLPL